MYSDPQKARDQAHAWYHANKERAADTKRLKLYGLTREGFWELLHNQGAKCAICHDELNPRLATHVDHEDLPDGSKSVRGLLCSKCNTGIGQFKHSEYRLVSAIEYLKREG